MIEHVYRRVQQVASIRRVVVLTDHEDIRRTVLDFGGEAEMTPEDCASGTDRIAWAARSWNEAAVINVQGDEPLIDPGSVDRLARHLQRHPDDDLVTLAAPAAPGEAEDPNAVKVVLDRSGYALYFSRAAIPYDRDGAGDPASRPVLKHLGIYGYQRSALLRLAALEPTPLEICEKLEQLRALENGMRLKVLRVESAAPGVDTEHDLARVERLLARSPNEPTGQEE
jgi:3-deoxy-manno-octulosonate cytidylyltransferase (CMP-KDO synthetase)